MKMNAVEVLQESKELNQSEKLKFSLTDVAKAIKQQLNKKYPMCKFSITTQFYSMGCCLHISLMECNFKVIQDFKDIPEVALMQRENDRYTREEIKQYQESKHHQLNEFNLREDYNPSSWCNGCFLTEAGHNLLRDVVKMADKFNWDNSDSQTDYYDVNFSLHIEIGKWNKPFIQP